MARGAIRELAELDKDQVVYVGSLKGIGVSNRVRITGKENIYGVYARRDI